MVASSRSRTISNKPTEPEGGILTSVFGAFDSIYGTINQVLTGKVKETGPTSLRTLKTPSKIIKRSGGKDRLKKQTDSGSFEERLLRLESERIRLLEQKIQWLIQQQTQSQFEGYQSPSIPSKFNSDSISDTEPIQTDIIQQTPLPVKSQSRIPTPPPLPTQPIFIEPTTPLVKHNQTPSKINLSISSKTTTRPMTPIPVMRSLLTEMKSVKLKPVDRTPRKPLYDNESIFIDALKEKFQSVNDMETTDQTVLEEHSWSDEESVVLP
ncbi:hypothetical protein HDV02_001945 [Globomyces sp. JEL0801]|nr:hypothetical protein HDV02_001945 [Globomyces sp. JEL0801]